MTHHPKALLFKDPGIQYPKPNMSLSFGDYITKCKTLIATTRVDLNANNSEIILKANTPFELRPQKIKAGVLLLHGLSDSPFQLREIGLELQTKGYLVRSLLLPGHGTIPGALLHSHYQQWIETVTSGIASLQQEVDQIILVGNSTGGSLALHQAIQNNPVIVGAILISPAIKIYYKFASVAHLPRALGKSWKRAAWFHKDPQETLDYAKYLSLPYNAIYQVYCLSQLLKKSNATCPLFFIVSEADKIIILNAVIEYFAEQTNPATKLLLYTDKPFHTDDKRIQFRPGRYPDQNIINLSHIALPYSSTNEHYGKNGDYLYASHVDAQDNVIYGEFLRNHLYYHKWKMRLQLTDTHCQRLTFNPDFTYMMNSIVSFVEQCHAKHTVNIVS